MIIYIFNQLKFEDQWESLEGMSFSFYLRLHIDKYDWYDTLLLWTGIQLYNVQYTTYDSINSGIISYLE